MARGFLKGLRKEEPHPVETDSYIDLGALEEAGALPRVETGSLTVRVAELHRYDDLNELLNMLYAGSFLVIDFGPIANEDLTMSRVTNELKQAISDVNGDMVALKKNILLVGGAGTKIDRKVHRGGI